MKQKKQTKSKRTVIHIRIDLLGVDIWMIVSPKGVIAERRAIRKKYPNIAPFDGTDTDTGALHTCCYEHYPCKHWMFFHMNPTIATINHETQHVVDGISDQFGIHDTEFRAYLFDYISGKIFGLRTL